MLALGSSGRKDVADEHGSRCRVQRLTDERFRLEFHLVNPEEIQAINMLLAQLQYAGAMPVFPSANLAESSSATSTAVTEASLKKLNAIIKRYPMGARKGLSLN